MFEVTMLRQNNMRSYFCFFIRYISVHKKYLDSDYSDY